jgi:hypothetical protein
MLWTTVQILAVLWGLGLMTSAVVEVSRVVHRR